MKYRSISYAEDETTSGLPRRVILRHDVDQSLERALALGRVEASFGLTSTFFVWIRSPFYNCWEPAQTAIIRQLRELGHQVGLHFDETAYTARSVSELERYMEEEAALLSGLSGARVEAVSFHRPSAWVLGSQKRFGNLINAYNSRFFNEYLYLSDSRRQWKQGCACETIRQAPPQLHLLTHAFWWTEEPVASTDRHIIEFLYEKFRYLDEHMSHNVSIYNRLTRP